MISNKVSEETVKVELEIPKNLHEALTYICNTFGYEFSELVTWGLRGEVDAAMGNNFEQLIDRVKAHVKAIMEEKP